MSNANKLMDAIHAVYREVLEVKKELIVVQEKNKELLSIISKVHVDDFELEFSGSDLPIPEWAKVDESIKLRDLMNQRSIIDLIETGKLPPSDNHKIRYTALDNKLKANTIEQYTRYADEINENKKVFFAFMMLRDLKYTNETACNIMLNKLNIKFMGQSSKANNMITAARYAGILTVHKGGFNFNPEFIQSLKNDGVI